MYDTDAKTSELHLHLYRVVLLLHVLLLALHPRHHLQMLKRFLRRQTLHRLVALLQQICNPHLLLLVLLAQTQQLLLLLTLQEQERVECVRKIEYHLTLRSVHTRTHAQQILGIWIIRKNQHSVLLFLRDVDRLRPLTSQRLTLHTEGDLIYRRRTVVNDRLSRTQRRYRRRFLRSQTQRQVLVRLV